MRHLPKALKTILNALAMQYEADYLSDDDKKANLHRVLSEIEQEKKQERTSTATESVLHNAALHAK